MQEFWKIAVGVAGLGAVGAFVFLSLYKEWLRVPALKNTLTKKQVFILFLVFLVLTFLFAVGSLAAYVMTHARTNGGPAVVFGSYTQNQGAADDDALKMILKLSQAASETKDQQIETLKAALTRVQGEANKGDEDAKAALEEARRSGDSAKLQAVLISMATEAESEIGKRRDDYLAICREIAGVAFLRGDIEQAYARLQTILRAEPNDIDAINRLGAVHLMRGEFEDAESCFDRILQLASNDAACEAVAYGNLAVIYQTRGELDRAEEMLRKALAADEELGRQEGVACQLGNLGELCRIRGELDRAEALLTKSLVIEQKLGSQEGMSRQFGNLGALYLTRGELDRAEELLRQALAINKQLGHQQGMACQYSNLGWLHRMRGDGDGAEEMHRKSLTIEEKLGRRQGVAREYGNLGTVYQARGDLDRSEELHRDALAIEEKLGRLEGAAAEYANLGVLNWARGELDRGEELLRKALVIHEKVGMSEGVAKDYANLGAIAEQRGDLGGAKELWTKARDLYAKIGMPHIVKQVQAWLDGLD